MLGCADDLLDGTKLDDLASEHDRDAIAHVTDHAHVVADEEIAHAQLALQVFEEVEDLGLDGDIEGAGGLVADDEVGVEGESAGDADALALPAAELVGVAVERIAGEPAAEDERFDTRSELVLCADDAVDKQGLAHDVDDAHARVEAARRVLKDDLHASAEGSERRAGSGEDIDTVKPHAARGGWDEPEDASPDGGFAGTGLADEAEGLASGDGEADAVNGADDACGAGQEPGANGKMGAQILYVEERAGGVGLERNRDVGTWFR